MTITVMLAGEMPRPVALIFSLTLLLPQPAGQLFCHLTTELQEPAAGRITESNMLYSESSGQGLTTV